MSATLPLIEEAIDVPMMDVKNVAKIIDDYVKYDVRDWNTFQNCIGVEFSDDIFYITSSTDFSSLEIFERTDFARNNSISFVDGEIQFDSKNNNTNKITKELIEKQSIGNLAFLPYIQREYLDTNQYGYGVYFKKTYNVWDCFTDAYLKILKTAYIYATFVNVEEEEDIYVNIQYNNTVLLAIVDKDEIYNFPKKYKEVIHSFVN